MTDSASLNTHVRITGLDWREARAVLDAAEPGVEVTFHVTEPALGGWLYEASTARISVTAAEKIMGALREHARGVATMDPWTEALHVGELAAALERIDWQCGREQGSRWLAGKLVRAGIRIEGVDPAQSLGRVQGGSDA